MKDLIPGAIVTLVPSTLAHRTGTSTAVPHSAAEVLPAGFFHAEEKADTIPLYSYRIVESKVLSLTPRGQRKAAQYFNNRSLEKLFQKFDSVKFFLTRDHLREVIVRR